MTDEQLEANIATAESTIAACNSLITGYETSIAEIVLRYGFSHPDMPAKYRKPGSEGASAKSDSSSPSNARAGVGSGAGYEGRRTHSSLWGSLSA